MFRVRTQFTPAGAVAYYRGNDGRAAPGAPLLFERNPVPMWVCDLETLRFLEVNVAAALRIADRVYVMNNGTIRSQHQGDELRAAGPLGWWRLL